MRLLPFAAAALTLAAACSSSTSEPEPELPFSPAEGTWTVTSADTTLEGCGGLGDLGIVDGFIGEGTTLALMLGETDGTFTLALDGGAGIELDPLMCSQLANRMDYVCDEANVTLDLGALVDALPEGNPLADLLSGALRLDIALEVDGTFTSETMGSATTAITVTCSGAACALLSVAGIDFPCTLMADALIEGPTDTPAP
ncbi:MAG: hypothetical protein AAGH15_02010 [Myxococcota bacterium]